MLHIGEKEMKNISMKEMIRGLYVSSTALYNWIDNNMPVERRDPTLFNDKSLKWVIENKPDKKELATKMMEKSNV